MKNLNNEYEQLVGENVPDLWDRIELGIDAIEQQKKVQELNAEKEETPEKESDTSKIDDNDQKKVIPMKRNSWARRYIPLVATAAVMVFGIMIFLTSNDLLRMGAKSSAPQMSDVAATSTAEAAAEAVYEDSDASYVEETGSFAEETCEESASENMAYAETAYEDEREEAASEEAPSEEAAREEVKAVNDVSKQKVFAGQLLQAEKENYVLISTEDGDFNLLLVPEKFKEQVQKLMDEKKTVEATCEVTESLEYQIVELKEMPQ